jgi:hypothetical protein
MTTVLATALNQTLKNDDIVKIYHIDIKTHYFNLGQNNPGIVILAILLHFLFSLLKEGFSAEVSMHMTSKDLWVKSLIYPECILKFFEFLICLLYPFLIDDHYMIFLVFQFSYYASCTIFYVQSQPYFNHFTNKFHINSNLNLSMLTIFFFIGLILDNIGVTLILSIFFQPIIWFTSSHLSENRLFQIHQNTSYSEFLLKNHSLFFIASEKSTLFELAYENFRNNLNKLLLFHISQYCSFIINNDALALIKISGLENTSNKLFHDFQIFKWRKFLKEQQKFSSPGLKMLKFIEKKEKALENDKNFCLQMMEIVEKVLDGNEMKDSIESSLFRASECLKTSHHYFRALSSSNPDSPIASYLYGSFLIEVLGKVEEGEVELAKSRIDLIRKEKVSSKVLNIISDTSSHHFVFSGQEKSLGIILYVCPNTCNLLETTEEEILGHSIKDFLPNLESLDIERLITNFIQCGTDNFIRLNHPLFLLNSQGFLLECFIFIECIEYQDSLNFLCIIEPLNNNTRQAAVIDESGHIIHHTQHFTLMMGISYYKVEKGLLQTFIGAEIFEKLKKDEVSEFSNLIHKSLALLMKSYEIKKVKFSVLYCFSDFNEIKRLTIIKARHEREGKIQEEVKFESNNVKDISIVLNQPIERKEDESEVKTGVEMRENYSTSSKNESFSFQISGHIRQAFRLYKVLKWIFIFSVIFKKVICLASCSSALLLITEENIKTVSRLDSIQLFGDISYELSKLALFFRSADNSNFYNAKHFFSFSGMNDTIFTIKRKIRDLRSKRKNFDFCKVSEILNEPKITVFQNDRTVLMENLFEILIKSQGNVENI